MEKHKRSRTAEAVAAVRAYHLLRERPVIFEDPLAIRLTSSGWRIICKNRFLSWIVLEKLMSSLRPVRAQVLVRARYAEDLLEKAVDAGAGQYVIVGAGLDSFALRRCDLASKIKVYELDHPATQQSKRDRLEQLKIDLPENLEFVSVDFERESVGEALARSSYSGDSLAFFSWLGTTMYLSRDAIFGTLKSIASSAAPGSEIVFDYAVTGKGDGSFNSAARGKLERFTARRGEPMTTRFDLHTFPAEVCELGFELLENFSPEEQKARYFEDRADGLRPVTGSYFGHFRVRG
jgi:methyltransferase (TIGR00027 family)